jgi:hypothetical protein
MYSLPAPSNAARCGINAAGAPATGAKVLPPSSLR